MSQVSLRTRHGITADDIRKSAVDTSVAQKVSAAFFEENKLNASLTYAEFTEAILHARSPSDALWRVSAADVSFAALDPVTAQRVHESFMSEQEGNPSLTFEEFQKTLK